MRKGYTKHMPLKVYKIDKGNIDTFIRFNEGRSNSIHEIRSLLVAYKALWAYFEDEKKEDLEDGLIEIWQVPIPFSRGLSHATLFRLNPYDSAYLVSPIRMEWLESPTKKL